jgi:glutamate synthase (NADPH/NADH) small chain
MKKKMLQFVGLKQETPEKRSTTKRKDDFNEIYNEFIVDKAKDQSS